MQIKITGRHYSVEKSFEDLINERLVKFDRYSSKIEDIHVILSKENFLYTSEIVLNGKSLNLRASAKNEKKEVAFDESWFAMEKQLKKFRDKIKTHNVKNFLKMFKRSQSEPDENIKKKVIIKRDSFIAKPMSVEEATAELELFNRNFMIFRNQDNDKINVIYKLDDGNYGLIEPN